MGFFFISETDDCHGSAGASNEPGVSKPEGSGDSSTTNAVCSGDNAGSSSRSSEPADNMSKGVEMEVPSIDPVVSASQQQGAKPKQPQLSSVASKPEESKVTRTQKPFSDEECLKLVKTLFDGSDNKVHNRYLCQENFCIDISETEKKRLLPKKFNHNKLSDYWWLSFVEGQGMFCILCKKHCMKHSVNKRDVFVNTPGTRYLEDALKSHSISNIHKSAIETEMVHKMSVFHTEICHKKNVDTSLYEKVFSTAYFLMKNFMPIRKLTSMLSMIETVYDYQNLKYFDHNSVGSQREFFLILGKAVKERVVEKVKKCGAFGILTDEASDISVTEQLITFVQYFDQESGNVHTSYLSCQDILEKASSANAQTISNLLVDTVQSSGLDIKKMTGFSSDGAAVMVGKKGGVAALLRSKSPALINVHCICHKLALSCTDSNESIKYIKEVELILRQLWSYFENSPKRMASYLKLQVQFKSMDLSKGASKTVASRLKKACRTRWLSFDASVKAVYNDYEALLQTLAQSQSEDAMALGLLKKVKTMKFLGAIYMLKDVLPVLSNLSRVFQKDSFCFSSIIPEVNCAKDKLDGILQEETPLFSLQNDIDSFTNISAELSMSPKVMEEVKSLFQKYITALKKNIDRRFSDCSEIVAAFCIFDPVTVPENKAQFKEYGNVEIQQIATHFFADKEEEVSQLKTEWDGMKYHLRDILKPKIPQAVLDTSHRITTTEWCLNQILSVSVYKQFFPKLYFIAEVAATLPVSNAWPERGASALKNLKTRHRNRIQNDLLEALLQVTVNGPKCEEAGELVKGAVSMWMNETARRKLARRTVRTEKETAAAAARSYTEAGVQTDDTDLVIGRDELKLEIAAALKKLNLEGGPGYGDSGSESDDGDF